MNAIRKFFVTAKHWQLFLIMCGAFALTGALMLTPAWRNEQGLIEYWIPSISLSVVFCIYLFLWIWSYGSFLSSVTPEAIRLKLRFFRLSVIFLFVYLPIDNLVPMDRRDWLLPLGFLWLLSALYIALFVTRSLIRAETGKAGTFTDQLINFLLVWFFPFIGIWFIQPRINRLYAANCTATCPQQRQPTQ